MLCQLPSSVATGHNVNASTSAQGDKSFQHRSNTKPKSICYWHGVQVLFFASTSLLFTLYLAPTTKMGFIPSLGTCSQSIISANMKWGQNMIWPSLPRARGGTVLYPDFCFSSSLHFCLIPKLQQLLSCKGEERPCKCPQLLGGQVGLFKHPELLSPALVSRGGDPGKNKCKEGQGLNIRQKHVSVNLDLNKLKPMWS